MDEGISMDIFKATLEKGNLLASGITVDYCSSVIVAKETKSNPVASAQEFAPELKLG
ncbi:hypothetical protein BDV12DRAFT_195682 [Aspergillus spectabilis]